MTVVEVAKEDCEVVEVAMEECVVVEVAKEGEVVEVAKEECEVEEVVKDECEAVEVAKDECELEEVAKDECEVVEVAKEECEAAEVAKEECEVLGAEDTSSQCRLEGGGVEGWWETREADWLEGRRGGCVSMGSWAGSGLSLSSGRGGRGRSSATLQLLGGGNTTIFIQETLEQSQRPRTLEVLYSTNFRNTHTCTCTRQAIEFEL